MSAAESNNHMNIPHLSLSSLSSTASGSQRPPRIFVCLLCLCLAAICLFWLSVFLSSAHPKLSSSCRRQSCYKSSHNPVSTVFTHCLKIKERIYYKIFSLTYHHRTIPVWSYFSLTHRSTRSYDIVILARPLLYSSLKVNNRSSTMPHLVSGLAKELRQSVIMSPCNFHLVLRQFIIITTTTTTFTMHNSFCLPF